MLGNKVCAAALLVSFVLQSGGYGANAMAPGAVRQAASAVMSAPTERSARLPRHIMPEMYDLYFEPDLDKATFAGTETISVEISRATNTIVLNVRDLKLSDAGIESGGKRVKASIAMKPQDEQVVLSFAELLKPGTYRLHTKFSGILNDKLAGFYRSTFKDSSGQTKTLAVTQMEPTDARRMFPCFDEPDMKASFKLSVKTKANLSAISNAPVAEEEISRATNSKIVRFEPTPRMSTYLVALLVGDFVPTEEVVIDGTPIRIWAVRGKQHLGGFARDIAARVLPWMNEYFGVPYPWKKLDMVAIPDFEAGAMENPGAITYRETLLLVDEKHASNSAMRHAANTIAHEMAHLWFGDYVTMKWWDDLWLNEAFATWMSVKAVDAVKPEWQYWRNYADHRIRAMETDSLRSTRSIHAEVTNPAQAEEMFDVITYSKGAAVLKMLEQYVGDNIFRDGIRRYMQKHAFANATTNDLWSAIQEVSGKPVKTIMHSWVHQKGFPVVSVQVDKPTGRLTLSQTRFLQDGTKSEKPEVWQVPVGTRLVGLQTLVAVPDATYVLLDKANQSFASPFGGALPAPLLANSMGVGFYRTRYESDMMQQLLPHLFKSMSAPERLTLLSDQWALAKSGMIPIGQYLDLASRFSQETDDEVFGSLVGQIASLNDYVDDSRRASYERFIRNLLSPAAQRLGWEPSAEDTPQTRTMRAQVLSMLGTLGQDSKTIAKARSLFGDYLKDRKSVDPDVITAVTDIVAYNGGAREFAEFKRLYKTATTPEEEHRSLYSLAEFRGREELQQALAMSLNKEVRVQDAPGLLGAVLSSRQGKTMAWSFIKTNWSRIQSQYPSGRIPHVLAHASSFNRAPMLPELTQFFRTHPVHAGKSTVAKTLERVKLNIEFRKRSARQLNDWLAKN